MKSAVQLLLVCFFLSLCLSLPYGILAQNLDIWCISGGDDGKGTGTVIRGPNGTVVLFDEGYGAPWADACATLLKDEQITRIDHAIVRSLSE